MEYLLAPCLSLSAVASDLVNNSKNNDLGDLLDGLNNLDLPNLRPFVDNSLKYILDNFDAYHEMQLMDEDDWDNLDAVRLVFEQN